MDTNCAEQIGIWSSLLSTSAAFFIGVLGGTTVHFLVGHVIDRFRERSKVKHFVKELEFDLTQIEDLKAICRRLKRAIDQNNLTLFTDFFPLGNLISVVGVDLFNSGALHRHLGVKEIGQLNRVAKYYNDQMSNHISSILNHAKDNNDLNIANTIYDQLTSAFDNDPKHLRNAKEKLEKLSLFKLFWS